VSGKTNKPLCFIDNEGGALAVIGASIARALGREDALATSIVQPNPVPTDVSTVLEEVGFSASVTAKPFDGASAAAYELVWLGETPPAQAIVGAQFVPCKLGPRDAGDLERLATARIARDRLERLVEELPR